MTTRYLIVPYAEGETEPRVLMARVELMQKRAGGRDIRGKVPRHAGQWALFDGEAADSTAADKAAFSLFRTYTGIDLSDPAARARYGMSAPRFEPLKDANYTPFIAVFLQADPTGLLNLAADVQNSILIPAGIEEAAYAAVETMHVAQAQSRIGPIPPPQDGWQSFIKRAYYGGQGVGALDVVFPTLVNRIARRSRMPGDLYAIALGKIGGGRPQPQPKQGRLLRFHVEHAEAVGGLERTYAANYDPGRNLVIRAVVEPAEAAADLAWNGGLPDPDGRGDRRLLSLGEITPYGNPTPITATLGRETMGVSIIVRPLLEHFDVRHAERVPDFGPSGGEWIAEYSEDEPPIEIEITTKPNTREAHSHLQWTGGQTDREGRGNVRIVPRNKLTDPEKGEKVRVSVNPWWDFILFVLPRLQRIDMVPALGIYPPVGGVHCVDFNPLGTYQIRATTWPDIALAHQALSWSVIAPAGNTLTRNRHPIDAHNTHTRYSVRVERRNVVLRALHIDVRVQPVVQALHFSGYVFNDGGGNWHSYAAAGHFGLPVNLAMQVTAVTAPNTAAAWAYLNWAQIDGPGANLAEKRIDLNAAGLRNVTASIGAAPPVVQPLDIRARQAWVAGDPHLSVSTITFRGPGHLRVRHDEIHHVGEKFDRTWWHNRATERQPIAYVRNTLANATNANINASVAVAAPPAGPVVVNVRATAFVERHNQPLHRMQWTWNGNAIGAVAPLPLALLPQAAHAPIPGEVVHAERMPIFWEMQVGAAPWILFDVTAHPFFVTLGTPTPYQMTAISGVLDARLYYTLLARSCAQAHGDNNEDAVIGHIFDAFRQINAGNGDNAMFARKLIPANPPLKYWNPDGNPGQNLKAMLRGNRADGRHSGTCRAWAEAFICMAAMHGINSLTNVVVTANTGVSAQATGFLVNSYTFTPLPAPSGVNYTHRVHAGPAAAGRATWGPGVVGQNNQNPPSSFGNHFIVVDAHGHFYDPSYGSGPHNSWQAWKTAAISALTRNNLPNAGFKATLAVAHVVRLRNAVTLANLN